MKTYQTYEPPTMPALAVTGAAARSVAAADEAGRAAHEALVAIHAAMVAHDQARDAAGIDATWCAQALRLLAREKSAIDAIANGTLAPRWRALGYQSCIVAMDGLASYVLRRDWDAAIKQHAATLASAGVPHVADHGTPEAWDDAAARGC